ncbi:asparagine synthase (glutamine-hydrolyzing) [Mucilaginibacter xinganensis]|uniref:asparagine synthase (glutamine-hydrolyzing) n=1 Tax=Mucilaginibacter xinganensis TaxID=1234841 RepID=A0A223NYT9_9SPHI|nr:asparagine synthase (glutamine-hydrolyzing) [Mucilaginibacter xinganensis]ASU34748.1 asparagine synthase (glutamine-hydrolysing) [Mucilaginibacter xinganensis]
MCGIYGSTIYYDDHIVRAKLHKVQFRGPDYSGFERINNVILGHNRLAIVDLDHRSNQPFTYHHLKIVFNGEIYNYQAIKAELKTFGYLFSTSSDTEVLAAAYLQFGENCVDHFNGMFAFVIYDTQAQTIFGARDRLGKKPFYYAQNGTDFEFASQPSQIIIARNVSIDQQAVNEYMIWGYVPEPRSAWQQIKKLQAGHKFTFSTTTGIFKTEKYWDLNFSETGRYIGNYSTAVSELKTLLNDSVKIRMQADVGVGVFLSGGIDSSLIAALASAQTDQVKTFCIKFKEKEFDESVFAEKIARHLKTNHHTIECNPDEGISLIENFGDFFDEPFADSSAIPTLLLSKYTKRHVTVALSGDGGDESFSGYTRYKWLGHANPLFKLPNSARKMLAEIIKLSPNYRHKLIAMGISQVDIKALYAYMFGGLEFSWLGKPDLGLNVPYMEIWSSPTLSLQQKMSAFDIKTYLNGDINTKVDRASMAFSLEARAPLMDYRVVDFANTLPDHFKFGGGIQKRILKDILYQYVPANLYNRPKSGFAIPFRHWFKNELKDYVLDQLSYHELLEIPGIDARKTSIIIKEHMAGTWNRFPQIWKLLVFKQWLKNQQTHSIPGYHLA